MGEVKCKIFRFNPDIDSRFKFQTFRVPCDDTMNVYQVLEYIYKNIDATLAFRRFCCFKGVCQSCLMKINGEVKRACSTTVELGDEITLEPIPYRPIIRDLIVDYGKSLITEKRKYRVSYGVLLKAE